MRLRAILDHDQVVMPRDIGNRRHISRTSIKVYGQHGATPSRGGGRGTIERVGSDGIRCGVDVHEHGHARPHVPRPPPWLPRYARERRRCRQWRSRRPRSASSTASVPLAHTHRVANAEEGGEFALKGVHCVAANVSPTGQHLRDRRIDSHAVRLVVRQRTGLRNDRRAPGVRHSARDVRDKRPACERARRGATCAGPTGGRAAACDRRSCSHRSRCADAPRETP